MIITISDATKRLLWAQRDNAGLQAVLDILARKAEALVLSARDAMAAGAERDGRMSESRALAETEREIRQLIKDQETDVSSEKPARRASEFY